jgi:xylulokinase
MTVIAAIDAGASEIKASLFDASGQEIAHAGRDCPVASPEAGWAEIPAEVLTDWPVDILVEAITRSGVPAEEVTAIGVTGSRATILPMQREGEPTGPAILWYDRRATVEAEALATRLGRDRFFETTGVPFDLTPSIMKILWLREHARPVFDKTDIFAVPQAVVLNALTRTGWYCDTSFGPYYGLMSLKDGRWSDVLLVATDIERRLLPALIEPGTVVGSLDTVVAQRTGLKTGTAVVASGSDAACFKIGVGVTGKAIASLSIATAGAIGIIMPKLVLDPRLTCCPAAIPGHWDLDALLLTGGSTYLWLRKLLVAAGAEISFIELDRLAAEIPPGSDGLVLVPHLAGAGSPLWDLSLSGTLTGLRLSHGPGHLARAVLEGVAYAHRHALDALVEVAGPVESLQLTGGGGGSPQWAQIMADVLNRPISVPKSRESASLGAAVIAGVATGVYSDATSAIRDMKFDGKTYTPGAAAKTYAEGYADYLRVLEGQAAGGKT